MVCFDAPRPRNANATRQAILTAARERFAAESYDDVGMRDIARDVGVDAALISRYFGSKEDLFVSVLDSCDNGAELMSGDRADWGARVANEIVFLSKDETKLRGLLVLLRSIASTKAMEIVQRSVAEQFHKPFSQWVGGPNGPVSAQLAASFIMGMAISREITGGYGLTPDQNEQLCRRMGEMLQAIIEA